MQTTKTCSKCKKTLPIESFTWRKSIKCLSGGYYCSRCKQCMSAVASEWQAKNYAKALAKQQSWRAANRGRFNANMAAASKKRHAAKLQRVPSWFDADKAKEIYDFAAEFREAGFSVEVDHIVPLQGKDVSGLHWHGNLRVCLLHVNRSKKNKLSVHYG